MPNVNVGLTQFFSDLHELATLKEMQPEGLSLTLSQAIPYLLPSILAEKFFNTIVVVCFCGTTKAIFKDFVRHHRRIEPVRFQFSPAHQGLSVGNLKDPRTGGTFRPIKQFASPVNIKEDLLNEIIRFSGMPENPLTNSPDGMGIASKEQCKSITVACLDVRNQSLICCVN
jgi:hypothetical protein